MIARSDEANRQYIESKRRQAIPLIKRAAARKLLRQGMDDVAVMHITDLSPDELGGVKIRMNHK